MKKSTFLWIVFGLILIGVAIFLIVYFTQSPKGNSYHTPQSSYKNAKELYGANINVDPIRNYKPQVFHNFLSPQECDYIIKKAKPKMTRSIVMGNTSDEVQDYRTSTQLFIDHKKDPILLEIGKRIARVLNMPVENQENMQVLHYTPGQQYKPHYDACGENSPYCIGDSKRGGKRLATFFIYLNDVEEGGETEFTKINFKVKPKKGGAVLFYNLEEDLWTPHHLSEHAGRPPKKGEKWAMNVWIRCGEYV